MLIRKLAKKPFYKIKKNPLKSYKYFWIMLYKYSQLNFNKLYTGFPSSTVNNALAKLSPLPPDFDPCDRQWLFDSNCERV